MADPASPRRVDATVAFDDLLVARWHRTPCVGPNPTLTLLANSKSSYFNSLVETHCRRAP